MKKILFIVSHLGSGSGDFCAALDANPRVQVYNTGVVYDHIDAGISLASQPHKCDTTAAIWAEELLYNHRLSSQRFYDWAKFVYVIREARPTLWALRPASKQQAAINFRYYTYRLRRICEMARKTPGAVLLTGQDWQKPLTVLEGYLTLKEPLGAITVENPPVNPHVTADQIRQAQASFERHYYYLRNLNLLRS